MEPPSKSMKRGEIRAFVKKHVNTIIRDYRDSLELSQIRYILSEMYPYEDERPEKNNVHAIADAKSITERRREAWNAECDAQIFALEILKDNGKLIGNRIVF